MVRVRQWVGRVALEIPFTVSGECGRACSRLPKPDHVLLLYLIYGVFDGFTPNVLRPAVGLRSGRCVLRHLPPDLVDGCGGGHSGVCSSLPYAYSCCAFASGASIFTFTSDEPFQVCRHVLALGA